MVCREFPLFTYDTMITAGFTKPAVTFSVCVLCFCMPFHVSAKLFYKPDKIF